ncbi:tyrosine-type recombinase/integrase [Mesorhizobium sp. M0904]|uniref:tyrosine-type recombinase/integrase n=1 Tax=Mesorhizobium sp. M0904 TaxID=2957022 RepID=UPI00333AE22F
MPPPGSGTDPLHSNDDDAPVRSITSHGSCCAANYARKDDLKSAASLPGHAPARRPSPEGIREHGARAGHCALPGQGRAQPRGLRPFARYLARLDPGTEFPQTATFGRSHRRLAPHIYSEQEICDLVTAASRLAPEGGLRPATYATIFGLIAATDLRRSEALQLRCSDVNLDGAFHTVRNTKFRKSRHVPIHATVVAKLRRYLAVRARHGARTEDSRCGPHSWSASPRPPRGGCGTLRSPGAGKRRTGRKTKCSHNHRDAPRGIPAITTSASRPCASARARS